MGKLIISHTPTFLFAHKGSITYCIQKHFCCFRIVVVSTTMVIETRHDSASITMEKEVKSITYFIRYYCKQPIKFHLKPIKAK